MKIDNMEYVLGHLKAEKGRLSDYAYIQSSLLTTDVSTDSRYQATFTRFYVVRRDEKWRRVFFSILEREKRNSELEFRDILEEIYHTARHNQRHQIEASFSSKLLATVRPEMPVWDKLVLENLGLKVPSYKGDLQKRITETVELYLHIRAKTAEISRSAEFPEWKRRFDSTFPEYTHFTDTKKLDLYLWQSR